MANYEDCCVSRFVSRVEKNQKHKETSSSISNKKVYPSRSKSLTPSQTRGLNVQKKSVLPPVADLSHVVSERISLIEVEMNKRISLLERQSVDAMKKFGLKNEDIKRVESELKKNISDLDTEYRKASSTRDPNSTSSAYNEKETKLLFERITALENCVYSN